MMIFKAPKTIPEFITNFIYESNAIEGIYRKPTKEEIEVTQEFLSCEKITIADLTQFVLVCAPTIGKGRWEQLNRLRDQKGLNVSVGGHIAPEGGIEIRKQLDYLLQVINGDLRADTFNDFGRNPYMTHVKYEILHPFLDGNGRSGRVIWLWQMFKLKKNFAPLGFMQSFYYQSLSENR